MRTTGIGNVQVAFAPADGPPIVGESDALDLIGALYGLDVDLVALPMARLAPDFFELRNGHAGAFLQKLTNYRLRVAFIGDIAPLTARSQALTDFVYESNTRGQVLFVADTDELAARLSA